MTREFRFVRRKGEYIAWVKQPPSKPGPVAGLRWSSGVRVPVGLTEIPEYRDPPHSGNRRCKRRTERKRAAARLFMPDVNLRRPRVRSAAATLSPSNSSSAHMPTDRR